MKKIFYLAFAALAMAFAACSEADNGSSSGDTLPVVTIYEYDTPSGYNPDATAYVRVVPNAVTSEVWCLVELKADKDAFVEASGQEAYTQRVLAQGERVGTDQDVELIRENLEGTYAFTFAAVAADGAARCYEYVFYGIAWETVCTGTYEYGILGGLGLSPREVELQKAIGQNIYRLENVFGSGYHLKFTAEEEHGTGDYFDCRIVRVPVTQTGYTYGSYGYIFCRDVGVWQGNDAFNSFGNYPSFITDDNEVYLMLQYYCSGGSLGYNNYDVFTPNE